MEITKKAPAKVNLFLEVTEKLPDGYHLIQSVMQSVTLFDTLTISKALHDEFICDDESLINDDNLVLKAKRAVFEELGIHFPTKIVLNKRIPIAAGLGGGSSDCAATLLALNEICKNRISEERLLKIGKKLGADVPFCIRRGICIAEGIGEIMKPIPNLPHCWFVVSIGYEKISTREAFIKLDSVPEREIKDISGIVKAVMERDLHKIAHNLYNAFEQNGSLNFIIRRILLESGALSALMSGSGPSVYGIFADKSNAAIAVEKLHALGYKAFLCEPYYTKITDNN